MKKKLAACVCGILSLGVLVARPTSAGGFALFEQGGRGVGMAGALTAQADDPSASYYNPAGLAFQDKTKVAGGSSVWAVSDSTFQGLSGVAAGATDRQTDPMSFPIHGFMIKKLKPNLKLGVGLYSPFLLNTVWGSADTFVGRRISLRSEINTTDLSTNLAFKITEKLGFGVGAIVRTSELSLLRRISRNNPLAGEFGEVQDVASFTLDTDLETGVGWDVGLLHRPTPGFSWGVSYRSGIDIDHGGSGTLTQILTGFQQFDDLVAATLPLGDELAFETRVSYPDTLSLGVALGLSRSILLEVDANWVGWSSFKVLPLTLPNNPDLSDSLAQDFEDTTTYRLGLRFVRQSGTELRFGAVMDETPQPDTTTGPFLPDADSLGLALGFGKDWLDVGFLWTQLDERTVTNNVDGIDGTYNTDRWLLAVTITK